MTQWCITLAIVRSTGIQLGQIVGLLVGRAKAHIPGVPMFPCALPWEEEPKDRLLLQNLMPIRITPDSYPNHAPPHSLPPIPQTGLVGPGPLVCAVVTRVVPLVGCGVFGTAQKWAHCWKSTIQFQSCESYPRIIPPIQSSRPVYTETNTHPYGF